MKRSVNIFVKDSVTYVIVLGQKFEISFLNCKARQIFPAFYVGLNFRDRGGGGERGLWAIPGPPLATPSIYEPAKLAYPLPFMHEYFPTRKNLFLHFPSSLLSSSYTVPPPPPVSATFLSRHHF